MSPAFDAVESHSNSNSDSGETPPPPLEVKRTSRAVAAVVVASSALLLLCAVVFSRSGRGALRADVAGAEEKDGLPGDSIGNVTAALREEVQSLAQGSGTVTTGGAKVAMTQVTEFVPYFNYKGPMRVTGSVKVRTTGEGATFAQKLSFSLAGLDPACAGNPPKVENACGIHIHMGKSCKDDAGIHMRNQDEYEYDPWLSVTYTAENGAATASGVKVLTGLGGSRVDGRALVIHNAAGGRIACGIITPVKLSVPSLAKYPGYKGMDTISGSVIVVGKGSAAGSSQTLFRYLTGQPTKCLEGSGTLPNSCGIHIHEGFSCAKSGRHFFDRDAFKEDPWAPSGYQGPLGIETGPSGYGTVVSGETMYDVMGRAVVVHDYDGARAACGILQPRTTTVAAFGRYGGYNGTLQVRGWATITYGKGQGVASTQLLRFRLSGVDPGCTEDVALSKKPPKNACGIHIHRGTSCTDGGDHYFNSDLKEDPWALIHYQAKSGVAKAEDVEVVTGLSMYDILNRVVVVHDSSGARVGCGHIGIKEDA